jgi:hypothetical protein
MLAPAFPAARGSDAVSAVQMTAHKMQVMPNDMPGCPDEQPAKPPCAKDCPFAVVCAFPTLVAAPVETLFALAPPIGESFGSALETSGASLAREPPPRPPKI